MSFSQKGPMRSSDGVTSLVMVIVICVDVATQGPAPSGSSVVSVRVTCPAAISPAPKV